MRALQVKHFKHLFLPILFSSHGTTSITNFSVFIFSCFWKQWIFFLRFLKLTFTRKSELSLSMHNCSRTFVWVWHCSLTSFVGRKVDIFMLGTLKRWDDISVKCCWSIQKQRVAIGRRACSSINWVRQEPLSVLAIEFSLPDLNWAYSHSFQRILHCEEQSIVGVKYTRISHSDLRWGSNLKR